MNGKQLNFAYKVRHALNENLDDLPATAVDRLAAARRLAVSRKKKHSPLRVLVPAGLLATAGEAPATGMFDWLPRLGLAIPLVVVALGLTGIYQFEQERRIRDLAEIDAAVLADELPLSAYLDDGFKAYLAKRGD